MCITSTFPPLCPVRVTHTPTTPVNRATCVQGGGLLAALGRAVLKLLQPTVWLLSCPDFEQTLSVSSWHLLACQFSLELEGMYLFQSSFPWGTAVQKPG